MVPVPAVVEPGKAFEEVPAAWLPGAPQREQSGGGVKGQKRQAQTPGVLRAVPRLMIQQRRICINERAVSAVNHHVPHGEGPGDGEPRPVFGSQDQSLRPGLQCAAAPQRQRKPGGGGQIQQVQYPPEPLPASHGSIVSLPDSGVWPIAHQLKTGAPAAAVAIVRSRCARPPDVATAGAIAALAAPVETVPAPRKRCGPVETVPAPRNLWGPGPRRRWEAATRRRAAFN